jgi:hypothetical protein
LLYVPIIGNILRYIGVIDASRNFVRSYLSSSTIIDSSQQPETIQYNAIGISSGGIAEIFRTNFSKKQKSNESKAKECILLRNRHGICKLALQTGK